MPYRPKTDEEVLYGERLGQRLRWSREQKCGLTGQEVGKRLGLKSSGHWSQIEAGKKGISVMNLMKAAKFLDVYPEALLEERNLTRQQFIDMNKFLKIITNPKDPKRKNILELLNK
jgi:transcriptional regulator with XRE-family HTH domain